MNQKLNVKTMTIAGMLGAIAIIIPLFAPKLVIPPSSFTLASHVPIIISMFISPLVAVFVAIVASIGFLIAGLPPEIVMRAATHIIFASIGALILKKNKNIMQNIKKICFFALFISIIHALCEVAVITVYYYFIGLKPLVYETGYLISVLLLVGVGSLIHSIIDFGIAIIVWMPLQKIVSIPVNARIKLKKSIV